MKLWIKQKFHKYKYPLIAIICIITITSECCIISNALEYGETSEKITLSDYNYPYVVQGKSNGSCLVNYYDSQANSLESTVVPTNTIITPTVKYSSIIVLPHEGTLIDLVRFFYPISPYTSKIAISNGTLTTTVGNYSGNIHSGVYLGPLTTTYPGTDYQRLYYGKAGNGEPFHINFTPVNVKVSQNPLYLGFSSILDSMENSTRSIRISLPIDLNLTYYISEYEVDQSNQSELMSGINDLQSSVNGGNQQDSIYYDSMFNPNDSNQQLVDDAQSVAQSQQELLDSIDDALKTPDMPDVNVTVPPDVDYTSFGELISTLSSGKIMSIVLPFAASLILISLLLFGV